MSAAPMPARGSPGRSPMRVLGWGVVLAIAGALLAQADASLRWPLQRSPPPWWPTPGDMEMAHAYGGLGLAAVALLLLGAWAWRSRGAERAGVVAAGVALLVAAASGVPIGWDGGRMLWLPAGLDPALAEDAFDALQGLHAGAAAAVGVFVMAALAVPWLRGARRAWQGGRVRLRHGLRPVIGRLGTRLSDWAAPPHDHS